MKKKSKKADRGSSALILVYIRSLSSLRWTPSVRQSLSKILFFVICCFFHKQNVAVLWRFVAGDTCQNLEYTQIVRACRFKARVTKTCFNWKYLAPAVLVLLLLCDKSQHPPVITAVAPKLSARPFSLQNSFFLANRRRQPTEDNCFATYAV